MTDYTIRTMIFSTKPGLTFEAGGCLAGFLATSAAELDDDCRDRLVDLIEAAGYNLEEYDSRGDETGRALDALMSDEDMILRHEGGRLAVVGRTVSGMDFQLEVALTPAGLSSQERWHIARRVAAIKALDDAAGTPDDLEALRDELNHLEEILLEINDELGEDTLQRIESIDEMCRLADVDLDTCGGLPSWHDGQIAEEWSTSACGRFLLYPPDGSSSGSSDENLSSGTIGWHINDNDA